MTGVVTCAHEWTREAGSKGPTNVTLTCGRCGASSVSQGKVNGKRVTTTLQLYPARGTAILDPQLYEFFIRQWEAECQALVQSGFAVEKRPPIVYTAARDVAPRANQPRTGRFATGRDVLLASAVVLLGGLAMLFAGIFLDVEWLRWAGGVALAVLVFLLLLVLVLS